MAAADGVAKGSISDFYLDRTPGAGSSTSYVDEEKKREEETERMVGRLLTEARMWRVANSAQWVAWGIVQAKVPELENDKGDVIGEEAAKELEKEKEQKEDEGEKKEEGEAHEEEEEFDYLAYAQDRAMFFWGDVVGLGLIKKEELPEKLRDRLKILDY